MAEGQQTPVTAGLMSSGAGTRRPDLRVSNQDREAVVDRLGIAMNEGRLSLAEYEERLTLAFRAVVYSELDALLTDLPVEPPLDTPLAEGTSRNDGRGVVAELPDALKVLWTILLTGVLVNLVVWVSVSAGMGHLAYFWPVWVAGPAGAALLGVSAGVTAIQRGRRSAK